MTAKTHGDGNLAKSIVDAISGGLIDLKAMIALADVDNEVRASMNGAITAAGLVEVSANAHGTAEARVLTAAVALASLAVGIAHAEITSACRRPEPASIAASGADVSFLATSVNSATAVSNVMTIGASSPASRSARPSPTIAAPTTARWDGTVTAGQELTDRGGCHEHRLRDAQGASRPGSRA